MESRKRSFTNFQPMPALKKWPTDRNQETPAQRKCKFPVDGFSSFPNFSASGSISGMKKMYYGPDALLVRYGAFIYNVSTRPEIYDAATPLNKRF